jgi:pimeloyl-ACP methyl ester carboxylesterase
VVGGVSQGGFAALHTALIAPDRITGLVLAGIEAAALDPAAAYAGLFAALAQQGPIEEPLAAQIIGTHPAVGQWVGRWTRVSAAQSARSVRVPRNSWMRWLGSGAG